MELEGIAAVVTAGAGGIGRAICAGLVARGSRVAIVDVDEPQLDQTVRSLRSVGGTVEGFACDISSDPSVTRTAADVRTWLGPIDLVVNHAGTSLAGPPEAIPMDAWRHLLELNVLGMVRGIHAFAPDLIGQGHGRMVLTTSSLALLTGSPMAGLAAPYITTKAAIIGLAQSLSVYLAPHGVGVTLFAPDLTDTAFPRSVRFFDDQGIESTLDTEPPAGIQTPDAAAQVLFDALAEDRFLASATPGWQELLVLQARNALDPLRVGEQA